MKRVAILIDNEFAYIEDVCICDKCIERGQLEFKICNTKGDYIDYIKFNELEQYDTYGLCELLHDKILEIRRKEND